VHWRMSKSRLANETREDRPARHGNLIHRPTRFSLTANAKEVVPEDGRAGCAVNNML